MKKGPVMIVATILKAASQGTLAQRTRITYECATQVAFHRSRSLNTTLEKLKALDAQRAQLLEGAKTEALANAEKAVAELNELGFHYTLTEGATPTGAPRKASTQGAKRQPRDLPCPICHFKTTPHHDGRLHRNQKVKKPFSLEELMERHLTKVG
jgi:hypothetical protein